mmetsp:Transcript_25035/g.39346  ORF Transcript_25035/g.39346 Transcript_25035/m.39346 type:complete len:173 (+) Transcript_25035:194-712(+)
MMQSSTNNEQKRSDKQDVRGRFGLNVQNQNELLPLRIRRRPTGGRNFNQSNNSKRLGRRSIDAMGPLPHRSRRARQIMPSGYRGRGFQPGNGDLNRRGPIPDMEPLPGRRNEPPLRRQVFLRHHFDGTVVSDDDNEEEEEEHEYLPTKIIGHGNHIDIDTVSVDSESDNETL